MGFGVATEPKASNTTLAKDTKRICHPKTFFASFLPALQTGMAGGVTKKEEYINLNIDLFLLFTYTLNMKINFTKNNWWWTLSSKL